MFDMRSSATVLVAGSLLIAGCATSQNPADGGFFNGVSGLSQGTYQARVDSKEAELSSLQSANDQLLAAQRQQNAQAAAVSSELAQTQARYNQVSANLNRLNTRLANLQASGSNVGSQQAQLQALQSRRNALASGGITANEAQQIQQLDAATRQLQQAIDSAFGAGVGL